MSKIEVAFPRDEKADVKIIKWKVSKGTILSAGRVLLSYQTVNSNNPDEKKIEKKLRSTEFGRVTELFVRQGDIVQPGVPMLHSIPELKVCPELAEKIGKADEERLLMDKKLALLVDLDQTIVHTTHENVPPNMKGVKHFQLHGNNSQWYHTRLRPGTEHFLTEMSKIYELHICTFGSRSYAHKVAEVLDEKGELFSQRILSRDECFNPVLKAANLHALFPCGDDLVCIIDDREDVWQGCGNLVQVKPYNFFRHTGDIHAPPGLEKKDKLRQIIEDKNQETKDDKIIKESEDDATNLQDKDKNIEEKIIDQSKDITEIKIEEEIVNKEEEKEAKVEEQQELMESQEKVEEEIENKDVEIDDDTSRVLEQAEEMTKQVDESNESSAKENDLPVKDDLEERIIPVDNKKKNNIEKKPVSIEDDDDDHDDYLLYLEDILRRIHSEFYDNIEKNQRKPLKEIIPNVRARVLKGLQLTFSGLVPTNQNLYQSRPYKVARAFGADVSEDLDDKTTHLVAIQPGTAKVHAAKKYNKIKIVNSDWLWSCAERWELVDERLYPLSLKARGSRVPPPHCSSPGRVEENIVNYTFASSINPLMSFTKEEIDDMGNEVEEDMSESEMDNTNVTPDDSPTKRDYNDDSDSSDGN
ncbi:hypothetical protein HCN44_001467 [Aphidius gifuensis]|uniref:RNA polymerase II subunit A C-terminal domain phosphatase n=1 Tax=Aphidius gifuensis TaxID=684658 RepID=A0A834XT72_APHGI|nr:hypothetical protein HCN44_001467 [Aphidius gifuensis]